MNNKTFNIIAFVVVCLVQIYVPLQMSQFQNRILRTGVAYKFKTAPIDPNDPFRGKYITLSFEENTFFYQDTSIHWNYLHEIYVQIEKDEAGFAKVVNVTQEPPTGGVDYVRAGLGGESTFEKRTTLTIDYPFDRYYMEESKALEAEVAYADAQRDTNQVAYARVSIKDGHAVIKDVFINETPILEFIQQ